MPFEETWVIYRDLHYTFEEIDAGFILTEFEPGNVDMSGIIEFSPLGAPLYAPGEFRLN